MNANELYIVVNCEKLGPNLTLTSSFIEHPLLVFKTIIAAQILDEWNRNKKAKINSIRYNELHSL